MQVPQCTFSPGLPHALSVDHLSFAKELISSTVYTRVQSNYNWAVFTLIRLDEVIVHVYHVPHPNNGDGEGWEIVEHIILSDDEEAEEEVGEEAEPMDDPMDYSDLTFFCRTQLNTVQVPTKWAKRYWDCSGNWTSKLHLHVGDDASVDVGVVKSNTTVKFSRGFATFMKANDINKGNPLLFSRIDEKEFLV
ncbi:hypothetical protein M0R45_019858 [Rubus argutus]|uniref:Uncharacterized protein n=1 Tax=Rubus argutus TaxID=59490 RepID=A0AAW1X8R7_RUBAR